MEKCTAVRTEEIKQESWFGFESNTLTDSNQLYQVQEKQCLFGQAIRKDADQVLEDKK